MRILVTGAAGFLGTHLCRTLIDQGHEVHGLDMRPGEFVQMRTDITYQSPSSYGGTYDRIYNLACRASPGVYLKHQMHTIDTCTTGVLKMIAVARISGGHCRLLQASTSEIYGDPLSIVQAENHTGNVDTRSPRSCYDEGKRAAETILMCAHRELGVEVRIPRIFNTYGPGMHPDDGRVITNMIKAALYGDPIVVHRPGTQTRSFCYVDDTIRGLIMCMESNDDRANTPINIGNPHETIDIIDLAKMINERCGRDRGNIVWEEGWPSDPQLRKPSIARAAAVLGWEPTVSLAAGLFKTIEYYKEILAT